MATGKWEKRGLTVRWAALGLLVASMCFVSLSNPNTSLPRSILLSYPEQPAARPGRIRKHDSFSSQRARAFDEIPQQDNGEVDVDVSDAPMQEQVSNMAREPARASVLAQLPGRTQLLSAALQEAKGINTKLRQRVLAGRRSLRSELEEEQGKGAGWAAGRRKGMVVRPFGGAALYLDVNGNPVTGYYGGGWV